MKIIDDIVKKFGVDKILHFLGGGWITSAFSPIGWWGILIGFALIKRMGNVRIIVNDECVEYMSGRSHRYYALVDFIESQTYVLYRGKKPVNVRRLVFEGYNNILYIHGSDFSDNDFRQMSEAVEMRAHKVKGIEAQ